LLLQLCFPTHADSYVFFCFSSIERLCLKKLSWFFFRHKRVSKIGFFISTWQLLTQVCSFLILQPPTFVTLELLELGLNLFRLTGAFYSRGMFPSLFLESLPLYPASMFLTKFKLHLHIIFESLPLYLAFMFLTNGDYVVICVLFCLCWIWIKLNQSGEICRNKFQDIISLLWLFLLLNHVDTLLSHSLRSPLCTTFNLFLWKIIYVLRSERWKHHVFSFSFFIEVRERILPFLSLLPSFVLMGW